MSRATELRHSAAIRHLHAGPFDSTAEVRESVWKRWGPAFRDAVWTALENAAEHGGGPVDLAAARSNGGPMAVWARIQGRAFPAVTVPAAALPAAVPATLRDFATETVIARGHPLFHRATCWLGGREVRARSVDLATCRAVVEVARRHSESVIEAYPWPATRWEKAAHGWEHGFADVVIEEVRVEEGPGRPAAWRFLPTPPPACVRLVGGAS